MNTYMDNLINLCRAYLHSATHRDQSSLFVEWVIHVANRSIIVTQNELHTRFLVARIWGIDSILTDISNQLDLMLHINSPESEDEESEDDDDDEYDNDYYRSYQFNAPSIAKYGTVHPDNSPGCPSIFNNPNQFCPVLPTDSLFISKPKPFQLTINEPIPDDQLVDLNLNTARPVYLWKKSNGVLIIDRENTRCYLGTLDHNCRSVHPMLENDFNPPHNMPILDDNYRDECTASLMEYTRDSDNYWQLMRLVRRHVRNPLGSSVGIEYTYRQVNVDYDTPYHHAIIPDNHLINLGIEGMESVFLWKGTDGILIWVRDGPCGGQCCFGRLTTDYRSIRDVDWPTSEAIRKPVVRSDSILKTFTDYVVNVDNYKRIIELVRTNVSNPDDHIFNPADIKIPSDQLIKIRALKSVYLWKGTNGILILIQNDSQCYLGRLRHDCRGIIEMDDESPISLEIMGMTIRSSYSKRIAQYTYDSDNYQVLIELVRQHVTNLDDYVDIGCPFNSAIRIRNDNVEDTQLIHLNIKGMESVRLWNGANTRLIITINDIQYYLGKLSYDCRSVLPLSENDVSPFHAMATVSVNDRVRFSQLLMLLSDNDHQRLIELVKANVSNLDEYITYDLLETRDSERLFKPYDSEVSGYLIPDDQLINLDIKGMESVYLWKNGLLILVQDSIQQCIGQLSSDCRSVITIDNTISFNISVTVLGYSYRASHTKLLTEYTGNPDNYRRLVALVRANVSNSESFILTPNKRIPDDQLIGLDVNGLWGVRLWKGTNGILILVEFYTHRRSYLGRMSGDCKSVLPLSPEDIDSSYDMTIMGVNCRDAHTEILTAHANDYDSYQWLLTLVRISVSNTSEYIISDLPQSMDSSPFETLIEVDHQDLIPDDMLHNLGIKTMKSVYLLEGHDAILILEYGNKQCCLGVLSSDYRDILEVEEASITTMKSHYRTSYAKLLTEYTSNYDNYRQLITLVRQNVTNLDDYVDVSPTPNWAIRHRSDSVEDDQLIQLNVKGMESVRLWKRTDGVLIMMKNHIQYYLGKLSCDCRSVLPLSTNDFCPLHAMAIVSVKDRTVFSELLNDEACNDNHRQLMKLVIDNVSNADDYIDALEVMDSVGVDILKNAELVTELVDVSSDVSRIHCEHIPYDQLLHHQY